MSVKIKFLLEEMGLSESQFPDLSFIEVKEVDEKTVSIVLKKGSPWEYGDLIAFETGVSSLSFEALMSFVYPFAPSAQDAIRLWGDWYFDRYRRIAPFDLHIDEDDPSKLIFPSDKGNVDDIESLMAEFGDFLAGIAYPVKVEKAGEKANEPLSFDLESLLPKEEDRDVRQALEEETPIAETNMDEAEQEEEGAQEEPYSYLSEEESESYNLKKEATVAAYLAEEKIAEGQKQRMQLFRKGNYVDTPIHDVYSLSLGKHVRLEGELFAYETRLTRNGAFMATFGVSDGASAVMARAKAQGEALSQDFLKTLQNGLNVSLEGAVEIDERTKQLKIYCHAISVLPDKPLRNDPEEEKRVELHLHTTMSAMDGVGDVVKYIKLAHNMGMKAMAITDHGVVQAFPDAESGLAKLRKSDETYKDFKLLYGCEFYAFHKPKYIYNPAPIPLKRARYCVFDFETTGLSNRYDRVTEFGAVIVENGMKVDSLDLFVNAGVPIPKKIQEKTHITMEMIKDAPNEEEALRRIMAFIGDERTILVSHNAPFDIGFLNAMRKRQGLGPIENPVIDTLALSHYLRPYAQRHNLGALSRDLKLDVYDEEKAHRADQDAEVLNSAWQVIIAKLCDKLKNPELTHADLGGIVLDDRNVYRHLKTRHLIAIAKNQAGLKDLFRLVSKSESFYMAKNSVPKIDFDDIAANRSNLLIGSACYNGEVFAAASERSEEDLEEAISFYDYIEIQPLENYDILVNLGDISKERLLDVLRSVIGSAKKLGKPVCATGDVHYVDPEDKIARDIFIYEPALGGGTHPLFPYARKAQGIPQYPNPDQHFRSTREMLDSFEAWLPKETAREIVIKNTNMIADLVDGDIKVLKSKLYTPDANLPGSDAKLREICYRNLRERYGEHPDPLIVERLEKELAGIIDNGYSVTYYIAHLLIKWANEHNFFVGSRGSVGSSFAANMAGITEVNALPPHYLCPHCHHFEWAEDKSLRSGFDLPKKRCPECGKQMKRDGQSIPFETFLGFNAEKVPDIDLNFPQDHLDEAHDYTRYLLSTPEENEAYAKGEAVENPHVIRAGTIGTVADKTAFGYIKHYYELMNGRPKNSPLSPEESAFASYLVGKCVGVKRTTGQHPGGIVVIPADMDICDFTPYQYPSDDPEKGWLTTHFDFGSMHDSILKLDELGHLDPMALRMMQEATGVDFRSLPMNDPKVLSLFTSPRALNLAENPLGFKTGAIALPEFGTNFVQGLLEESRPKTFNDLLIISGLSHGTDVWNNNAEELIKEGKVLDQVIGCRDDIMNYLIGMGVESSLAFKIMEDVRHGKGIFQRKESEYVPAMKAAGVPDWYIDSCRKIQYLFPRAHATAYVMAAVRVAWYKVYEPLAFYSVYFSTRCDNFDLNAMIGHEIPDVLEALRKRKDLIDEKKRRNEKTDVDEEVVKTLIVTVELMERGYKVEGINLMRSDARYWGVDSENNAIIPPFTAIANFPLATALGICEARKSGEFLSQEDLSDRVKKIPIDPNDPSKGFYSLGQAAMDALKQYHALDGLGETAQMSLFDFLGI